MSIKPPKKKPFFSANGSLALDMRFKLLNFSPNNTSNSIKANINNYKNVIKYSKKNTQPQNYKYKTIKNSRK